MELTIECDTYAPNLSDSGKYEDCAPRFGNGMPGYYCGCGARKDKLYTSSSMLNTHFKTKTHQKWLELLNLNRTNHFTENMKLNETVSSQRLIIARLEKAISSKDATIDYLTHQLSAQRSTTVVDFILDIN
jgi:hypothetical protein